MNWTPEAVRAEMDYRLERARADAFGKLVTRDRPSWLRRLRARTTTPRSTLRAAHS
jgi:hypothetical protein